MVNLKEAFKDITKRAKVVERLYTLYEIKQNINEKITKTEQELVKLDMELAKDENKQDRTDGSDKK
jgi:hypothetical protein